MKGIPKGSKVLVAGGSGFIGTNLILHLVRQGYYVQSTIHKAPLKHQVPGVTYIQADLSSKEECQIAVRGMDYVFMCAASTSGAAMIASHPLIHVTPNVVMNAVMLEAAYEAQVKKFIFISSGVVYPAAGDRPAREEDALVGHPFESYYLSGWMKRYAEILCRSYAEKIKKPMATVVVRPSNIFGPYDKYDFQRSHMTAALIRKVVQQQNPLEIWGTGEDIRDLIYIDDFIEGLCLAAGFDGPFLDVNIATGVGYRVKDVAKTLLKLDGRPNGAIQTDPSKPSMIPILLFSTEKAQQILGFRATTPLEVALEKTMAWLRKQNPSVYESPV